ncbi:MAG: Eco57I restriction-modification methylase domain-containing protein [Candidatus Spyradosoma sp.]
MMNFLKRLCSNGFSEDAFKTLCTRKWSSFAFAPVPLPDDADFVAPKLFGFVKNLPASTQNAGLQLAVPIVVARLPDGRELGERSSRKRQFDFAKKTLAAISDSGRAGGVVLGGLFAFYDAGGNFRLSLVSGTPDAATHKLRYNSFRRQSFYVRKGGADCRTFIERLAMPADSFAALREIFSVEKLTKEFYAQVEAWFLWARERVSFPGAAELGKDELTHNSDMALRLITRLIFIWFLRAKKLVPEELFDKRKIDELLKYDDANDSTYYKAILQNLFFATLNTKRTERGWVERRAGKQEYFRYKRFFRNDAKSKYLFDICANVPFVNGGLFENLDRADVRIDCFSNRKDNEASLSVPDELFFDAEKGILPLLSRYNFTVEENAPADEDVSLDPELLGRVFENLLAFVNPETHEQARKATGSFYTPREIVRYMVDESLIAYLTEKCGAENTAAIRELVSDSVPPASDETKRKIVAALDGVKILDPACGSGAFPMGALARIIEIHEALGALDPADGEAVYKKKLDVIQNCLYGVDIQSIAVQISKLRFFISLLCEQKVDRARENFGISVLPNLESKIVCANTLVALPRKLDGGNALGSELALEGETRTQPELALGDVDEIRALRERLKTSRKNYFAASSKQDKARLRKEDEKLRAELAKKMLANAGHADAKFRKSVELVASWNPYDPNTSAPFFDPVWMFGFDRSDAFDIVIGNPPYIQLQNDDGALAKTYENSGFSTFARMGDIYCLFYERGREFLKSGAHLCFITSNKWMRAGYGEATRRFFAEKTNPKLLVDFSGMKIFEAATVDTNVLIYSKSENTGGTFACTAFGLDSLNNLSVFVSRNAEICRFDSSESWVILSPIEQSIKHKIERAGTPLKDWDINIYRGVLTGFNEAFIISGSKREEILAACKTENERLKTAEIIRPILRGRDIKRYSYTFADLWLINTHNGIKEKGVPPVNIEDFPAIKAHLDCFGNKLRKRADKGDTPYNLRNCAYMEDFSKQKIVWAETMRIKKSIPERFPRFGYCSLEYFTDKTCFILVGENLKFLLGILNSSVTHYQCKNLVSILDTGGFLMQKIYIEKIIIPHCKNEEYLKIVEIVELILNNRSNNLEDYEALLDESVSKLYGFSLDELLYLKKSIAQN